MWPCFSLPAGQPVDLLVLMKGLTDGWMAKFQELDRKISTPAATSSVDAALVDSLA